MDLSGPGIDVKLKEKEKKRKKDKGPESRFSVPGPDLETDLKRGSQKENPSLGT
jgi:hypothetical protein